ncbi:MAG: hypothetical protein ACT4OU_11385 [Hyphomicrobium sp.]
MKDLPDDVDAILARLAENSRVELNHMRTLAEAIRRADEQMLRDVRNLTLQHEIRREEIFGEMQNLAARLCAVPARARMTMIDQPATSVPRVALDAPPPRGGGDWREAAQKIDDELEYTFGKAGAPRH